VTAGGLLVGPWPRVHRLPAALVYDTPDTHPPTWHGSIGAHQQQSNDNDQTVVSRVPGLARHSHQPKILTPYVPPIHVRTHNNQPNIILTPYTYAFNVERTTLIKINKLLTTAALSVWYTVQRRTYSLLSRLLFEFVPTGTH
jgi:hypothetical protein